MFTKAYKNQILAHLCGLEDEIYGLNVEYSRIERELQDMMRTHFVCVPNTETFSEHMNRAEYPKGYYESVEEAKADNDGGSVYNLLGELQFKC
jgi:hypothetical protein